jgi:hypothetical protein
MSLGAAAAESTDRGGAPDAAEGTAGEPVPSRARPELHLSELLVGAVALAVTLLAWAALGLADLGKFSLPAVLVLWVAALAVVVVALRRFAPLRVRVDPVGCVGVVVLGLLAALMFLPGFAYGITDKDPGGYTEHAFSIARTGSYRLIDPTLDGRIPGGPVLQGPGARFGGIWLQKPGSDVIVPQFYHLWPALLAVAHEVAGQRGMAQVPPLIGILAVLAAALALRRAVAGAGWLVGRRNEVAGLVAGGFGGVLLATNMLEVWQAKYPTTEISAQLFFLGSLLGLIVALQTGWRPAAGLAGLFTAIGFLDRGDGLIPLLLAAGLGATLLATRRWDSRATWFAAGAGIVLPHALWQAYSSSAGLHYSQDNDVPGLRTVVVVVVGVFLLGAVLRPLGRRVAGWLEGRRPQRGVGALIATVAAGLVLLGFLRPRLFGADYGNLGGSHTRTYDEQILGRLAWFLSVPMFVLLVVAVAVIALRRWSAGLWVLAVPLLLIFPVYAVHARNSTRLMWWSRRYVPSIVPLVILLAAAALTAIAFLAAEELLRRRPTLSRRALQTGGATLALLGTAALTVFYVGQSLPLRSHSEFGGSFEISASIAADAGPQQGVFLWQRSPACCLYAQDLFGGALWLERNQISAILPTDPTQVTGYLANFRQAFPGQPEFVIWHGQDPPGLPGMRLVAVQRVNTALSYWEETETRRPDKDTTVPVNFVVYRVLP